MDSHFVPPSPTGEMGSSSSPQTALLDFLFPGFSVVFSAIARCTKIDLNFYFPVLVMIGLGIFAFQYLNTWVRDFFESYLMSTADIRIDDEMYNMIMHWVATQNFSKRSRNFVANTNLNSRTWFLQRYDSENEDDEEDVGIDFDNEGNPITVSGGKNNKKDKKVQFTPSFGTHYFFYKRHLLLFRRQEDPRQAYATTSEREQISISSFGRNPAILKQLLDECRISYSKNDENRTVIYRGGMAAGGGGVSWTRCVSRVSRPFETVVLDEKVKEELIADMREYLHPLQRRWYSNRGIPYRRGYLLYGPPGTGKSSLSFAIAGYFKLQIYIVSLNSPNMNEENLSTLFSELPKQCVVLLEDIDTAGLTHTRDTPSSSTDDIESQSSSSTTSSRHTRTPLSPSLLAQREQSNNNSNGRISLSALLNILDGVASQEGRVLIMTTNHIEKLDEALIRPGRVDMQIKFSLANAPMIKTIFQSIFATLEADFPPNSCALAIRTPGGKISKEKLIEDEKEVKRREEEARLKREEDDKRVRALGEKISKIIPGDTFSPAEIQGFFLKYKRQPERCVAEAAGWAEKKVGEKKRREKAEEEEKVEAEKREQECVSVRADDDLESLVHGDQVEMGIVERSDEEGWNIAL